MKWEHGLVNTHHDFVFAGSFDNSGTGYARKLEGEGDVQSVTADGLAFWAGGFNRQAPTFNAPVTGSAYYSITFV